MIYFVHWDNCSYDETYMYSDSRKRGDDGKALSFRVNLCEKLFDVIKTNKTDGFVFIVTENQKRLFLASCKKYDIGEEYFKYKSNPWTNGNYPSDKGNLHTFILSADENFKDKLTVVNRPKPETEKK